tara:strand:+ start:878 stop:1198 length:321 start_codon:yes stop_codon:yes gene_type:complete
MASRALVPVTSSRELTTIPKKKIKKLKKSNIFERSGKVLLSAGRKVVKGGKTIVKKGIKLGAIGTVAAGGIYAAGASSRRYAKSPKVGEGRDLRDTIMAMSKDYYS